MKEPTYKTSMICQDCGLAQGGTRRPARFEHYIHDSCGICGKMAKLHHVRHYGLWPDYQASKDKELMEEAHRLAEDKALPFIM